MIYQTSTYRLVVYHLSIHWYVPVLKKKREKWKGWCRTEVVEKEEEEKR